MGTDQCCKLKSTNDEELLNREWDINDKVITKDGDLTFEKLRSTKFLHSISYDNLIYTPELYYKKQKPSLDIIPKEPFTDTEFPAIQKSIMMQDQGNNGEISEFLYNQLKELTFERPINMFKDGKYVLWDKIEYNDVHQGLIENSYFLSAICAIAEFPERLNQIFLNKTVSKSGCYAVQFYVQGKPKVITVDDNFPCHSNRTFAFSYSGPGEIWVQILEKAWAKLNSSYYNTINGLPSEALSTLTNAPVITYNHKKFKDPNSIWALLKENDIKEYITCSNATNSIEAEQVGLIAGHTYSVLSVHEYQGIRLLKLMNPWGAYEWKGEYSDSSEVWTEELRNAFGQISANDGVFYMSFEDFLKHFNYTYVCKYEKGFYYNFKKFFQCPIEEGMVAFRVSVSKDAKVVFGVHQKQKRFYKKVHEYQPQFGRIIVTKYTNNSYRYIASQCGETEKIFLEIDKLESGEYQVFVRLEWPYHEDTCSYVVSSYSDAKVEFSELNEVRDDYLKQIFGDFLSKKGKQQKLPDVKNLQLFHCLEENEVGYYLLQLKNNSESDIAKFSMEVSFESDKLRLISKHHLTGQDSTKIDNGNSRSVQGVLTVVIPPSSDEYVVFEMLDNFWNCSLKVDKMEYNYLKVDKIFDPIYYFLLRNVYKIQKIEIGLTVSYFEVSNDDFTFLVFLNNSKNIIIVKATIEEFENYEVEEKVVTLNLSAFHFDYVKLKKQPKSGNNNRFVLRYCLKKL